MNLKLYSDLPQTPSLLTIFFESDPFQNFANAYFKSWIKIWNFWEFLIMLVFEFFIVHLVEHEPKINWGIENTAKVLRWYEVKM